VDLEYLKAHPDHLPTFLTHQRIRETPVGGGNTATAQRLTLDDGASVFAKALPGAPDGFFTTEAAGLRWLAEVGAPPVPEVIAALPEMLVLAWVDEGAPSPRAAERFGRDLAAMHAAGAASFGAPWPGFIGTAAMDNTPSTEPWPIWFTERRLRPMLRLSADRQALDRAETAEVERVLTSVEGYGGAEPPSRIHGDLWPGNVLWGADGKAWLVDPAAHGGHRETDLALLGLWGGVAHHDRVLAAYQEQWPLADGWAERVPLHRLFLLLAHTALFGASYRSSVLSTVRSL
jgi:fructosamine-3-kinase